MVSRTGAKAHTNRWRAYVTMMYGQHQSPAIAAALQAFDDLGIADKVPTSLEVAAATILNQALKSAGQKAMDSEDRAQHEKKVVDSLMRFQSNQFKYDNAFSKAEGFKDDVAVKYSAAAVFRFTSRLNHSCSPSYIPPASLTRTSSAVTALHVHTQALVVDVIITLTLTVTFIRCICECG